MKPSRVKKVFKKIFKTSTQCEGCYFEKEKGKTLRCKFCLRFEHTLPLSGRLEDLYASKKALKKLL